MSMAMSLMGRLAAVVFDVVSGLVSGTNYFSKGPRTPVQRECSSGFARARGHFGEGRASRRTEILRNCLGAIRSKGEEALIE